MEGIGWIGAIIIGGLAGWIAQGLTGANTNIWLNIILGILGAIVANALLSIVGISFAGWIGNLIAGVIGAVILIAIVRAVRGRA